MTPENSSPKTEERPIEQPVKHLDGDPLSVAEIIANGNPVELKKLDDKYTVTPVSEKIAEDNKPDDTLVVNNEKLSSNFPGSIIIKKTDGAYFAVRKNKEGEWGGNSFTLMSDGNIGAVYQEHNIDKSVIETAEKKLELTIPVLSRDLMGLGPDKDKRYLFLNELKSFPPEKTIELYHGLNGGIGGALKVLESPEQGIKQISGPCLAVFPLGQFWKPGDAGFKYSVKRGDIEFPGENKPGAKFRMNEDGIIFLINGLDTLSLTNFEGVVMRTTRIKEVYEKDENGFNKAIAVNGEWVELPPVEKIVDLTDEEIVLEKKIQEKLKELSNTRKTNNHQ